MGSKHIDAPQPSEASARVRVTCFLSSPVYRNLELFCLQNGSKRQHVITTALAEYLQRHGMKPEKCPKINYSYDAK